MDPKVTLSKQDIIDYAARYVDPKDVVDFPFNNDLFCLMGRKLSDAPLKDEEGWEFNGYGICTGYVLDDLEMPLGKWIWMYFAGLSTFPPQQQVLKLQPPHIVKGGFQNPERTHEFRFLKIDLSMRPKETPISSNALTTPTPPKEIQTSQLDNIVPFRRKNP